MTQSVICFFLDNIAGVEIVVLETEASHTVLDISPLDFSTVKYCHYGIGSVHKYPIMGSIGRIPDTGVRTTLKMSPHCPRSFFLSSNQTSAFHPPVKTSFVKARQGFCELECEA